MATINIDGVGQVNVDDKFLTLSHEDQNKTVEEITREMKAKSVAADMSKPKTARDYAAGLSSQRSSLGAIGNIPTSAAGMAESTIQAVAHPINTLTNLKDIGKGLLQKFGLVSGNDAEKYADAVGQFLKDRYGSLAAVRKTANDDPVGLAADLSIVLSGGSTFAARAPGAAGELARTAGTVARAIDPVNAAAAGLRGAGNVAANVTGLTTGTGGEAIKIAARAGAEGGEAGQAFRQSLTGAEPLDQVVTEARSAVGQLREQRGTAYREAMKTVKADQTVLDFDKIDKAVEKVANVKKFKGQDLSPTTAAVRAQITGLVDKWKNLDPAEFHTPEGLDALKQSVGEIVGDLKTSQPGSPSALVAENIYNSIRQTIVDQAPEYGQIMKGYEEATKILKEIETTLSLKPNANIDTTVRKLQSVLRNNVSTNYGRRAELIDFLTRAGAPHLLQKLAGQTLSSVEPRGLARLLAGGEAVGGLASGDPRMALRLGGGLLASSPRLVGNVAYGLGATTRLPLRTLGRSAFQAGRLSDQVQ